MPATSIDIPWGERGVTRVFSLSMDAAVARRLSKDAEEQRHLLGAEELQTSGIEVFPLSDLGDLGLPGYLRAGLDIQQDALKRDNAKLSALEGWVLLLHSSAFGGDRATINPSKELTLIGTYQQTPAEDAPVALQAGSAKPYSGTPAKPKASQGRKRSGASVLVGLFVLIVVGVMWWAL